MAYTRHHARPLLTDAEYDLFTASLSDHVGEMTPAELRGAISRIRRFRDKARDLHQRQAGAVRERAGARGAARTANQRTAKKETALSEALARFEKRLEALESAGRRSSKPPARQSSPPPAPAPNRAARRAAGRNRSGADGGFMSSSAGSEAAGSRKAPQIRISASRAATGRRHQAKRDAR